VKLEKIRGSALSIVDVPNRSNQIERKPRADGRSVLLPSPDYEAALDGSHPLKPLRQDNPVGTLVLSQSMYMKGSAKLARAWHDVSLLARD
jgi:hypothetical protein